MCVMEVSTWIDAIDVAGDRMVEVIADGDLDRAVPSCPGWDIRELVRHLGGVHRWATVFVNEARTTSIKQDRESLVGGWPADEDLHGWFSDGYQTLTSALRSAPADLDCWTFLAAETPLKHWGRRQAHETAIHRVDAELAARIEIQAFGVELAADGVDEYLTALVTGRSSRPRSDQPRSVQFECTDTDRAWAVSYNATDLVTVPTRTSDVDALISGTANDLYLWVWRRIGRDAIATDGDLATINDWNDLDEVWEQ